MTCPFDPSAHPLRVSPVAGLEGRSSYALGNAEVLDGGWWHTKPSATAAAISCAVSLLASGFAGPLLGAAMSAVLVCATNGDPA